MRLILVITFLVCIWMVDHPKVNLTPPVPDLEVYYTVTDDLILLASLINSEAHGEDLLGKLLVGSVVLNRMKHNGFPSTLSDVIFQKNQFNGTKSRLFRFSHGTPEDIQSIQAATILLRGGSIDPEVLYFINPKMANPYWRAHLERTRTLEAVRKNHHFYS